ncbi:RagB/SusD family nutrient uptake outer membrane protein [Butyricimonas paravirosa]|uniref:RagB/SusD family nutrient uptake outer membrane protein n=1 Tax=Butyricimonas paravirosa TaxID=1472417 RepID=UPI00210A2461|nr:RagB/SusD family nutrient uptake outer membrane protein [Butyricimonas paravirosa]MCQ4872314.1 RagB/SusD family nutrient uptake outer membrane protein [Butyricimonas paravirosa]
MKKIKILLMTTISLMIMSCEDWLDVNASSQLDRNELFKTENGYGEALIGVYGKMCDASLYGRELTFNMLDLMSAYYTTAPFQTKGLMYWYKYAYADPTNTEGVSYCEKYIEDIWNNIYTQIANLNSLLETIDDNQSVFSENNYELIKGEALGLRAFLHFDLLRLFAEAYSIGKDKESIPYVTKLTAEVTPLFKQESVIMMILEDLENAKKLLENDPMRLGSTPDGCLASLPSGSYLSSDKIQMWHNRRFRFNYYATIATMARVYLWKGDQVNALRCAQEVITDQETKFPWVLKTNLSNIGKTTRNQDRSFVTEHIFALNMTNLEELMDTYNFDGEQGMSTGWNNLQVNSAQKSAVYENTADLRYLYWFEEYGSWYMISKFYQNSSVARYFQERVPLIRLSEMYYIAAECASITADGVEFLENVRNNRGLTSFALNKSMSKEELESEIRKEYKKEFWGEGQLWYYYKRKSYTAFSAHMKNVDFFTFNRPDTEESNAGRN